jgi:hypothetical protein
MTGMVRKALLIAAGFAVVASVASAGVPDPRFSTIDPVAVGTNSGAATAQAAASPGYDVIVRDVSNAPLAGVTVTLNYATSAMKVYSTQNAGTTVNCPAKSISRVTNGSGAVVFGPRTGKFNNSNTVEVSANGVVLGNVKGRSTDIDGLGGQTSLGDLSLFAAVYGAVNQETDFDVSGGVTGLGDFSIFAAEYAGLILTYCP